MAIVSVDELFEGRSSSTNGMFERTYSRVFEVLTDSPHTGHVAIRIDSRIPHLGQFYTNGLPDTDPEYEFDHGAFVGSVKIDQASESVTSWRVTVEYGPYNTAAFGADPTLWPMRVQFGGERTEKVCDFDRNGDPIKNSAGDRFGEPVTVDDHITTLLITRNEAVNTYSPALASLYSDTINDATWNGFAAGKCKMGIIASSEPRWAADAQLWYYEVQYPIQISRTVWVKDLLDQGYNELVGSVARPIMAEGQPLSEPRALDGSGHQLAPTDPPVVLTFNVFEAVDWSGLNLDLSTRLGA